MVEERVVRLESSLVETRERVASLETSVESLVEAQRANTTAVAALNNTLIEVRTTLGKWGFGGTILVLVCAAVWAIIKVAIDKLVGGAT